MDLFVTGNLAMTALRNYRHVTFTSPRKLFIPELYLMGVCLIVTDSQILAARILQDLGLVLCSSVSSDAKRNLQSTDHMTVT